MADRLFAATGIGPGNAGQRISSPQEKLAHLKKSSEAVLHSSYPHRTLSSKSPTGNLASSLVEMGWNYPFTTFQPKIFGGSMDESPAYRFLRSLDALSQGKMQVRCDHFQQSVQDLSASILAEDFAKIVAFSADQLGRWDAEWLFSPALTPDSDAACEKEAWAAAWETNSNALMEVFPALRANLKRERDLICLSRIMEKRREYNRGKPLTEFTRNVLSRVGLLLCRIGLQSTGHFLYKRALFPPNTVGRANYGGYWIAN